MNNFDDHFKGLTALIESTFPKKCAVCGKTYETADSFLTQTQNMPNGRSCLKEALEEDGTIIVEVFRNCMCGSTLMDEFNCRRDESIQGKQRRAEFDKLLKILQNHQIPAKTARNEILKVFHGENSEVLDLILRKDD